MMLEIRNLSAAYGMHRALDGVSINVDEGEIVVILGANGAGKSTLLRAVAGLCEGQVQGDVMLDGDPLEGIAADEIVERGIAFVPEGRGVFGEMTVAENLELGAYSRHARLRREENLAHVFDLFPKLRERRNQLVRTMSGGEQQMVAIGRAMMADPKILMLDEPSLGLSPLLCKELFQNLSRITETGLGVLLVEQNAKQSLAIADRGYLLENGEITGEDRANALLSDPAVQAAYLGGAAGDARPASGKAAAKIAETGPSETSRTFVTPRSRTAERPASDRLAGEAIQSLVARASDTGGPKRAKPASSPAAEPMTTRSERPAFRISQDPEISALLKNMEDAARAARTGRSAGKTQRSEGVDGNSPLPKIEVFRKRAIEIYRRGPDGKLHKVET
jgi:branched-chain amino acid transport system ATP-binding protein